MICIDDIVEAFNASTDRLVAAAKAGEPSGRWVVGKDGLHFQAHDKDGVCILTGLVWWGDLLTSVNPAAIIEQTERKAFASIKLALEQGAAR